MRWNIDVGLQYLEAWLNGLGCVPIYNLMEDAATAEICRAQVWQWVEFGAKLKDGRKVTGELVRANDRRTSLENGAGARIGRRTARDADDRRGISRVSNSRSIQLSGLNALVGCPRRIFTTPCVAMSCDAARKSACATHVARTLVFAAFALLRTPWDFHTKVLARTAQ